MPRAASDSPRLTRLDRAGDGAWWLRFTSADRAGFERVLTALRHGLPTGARRWDPEAYAWWIASDAYLRMLTGVLPGLDAAMRTGGVQYGESASYKSGRAVRPDPRVPTEISAAFDRLCLTPDAPVELIAVARRYWARVAHPDAGGEHQHMVRINRDADLAERWAGERQKATPRCRAARGTTGAP